MERRRTRSAGERPSCHWLSPWTPLPLSSGWTGGGLGPCSATAQQGGVISGEPVGSGLSYWARIQISGDLETDDLVKVLADIQKILDGKVNGKPVKGKIASQARTSDKGATVTLNATY
jgi:hypothetical protein